MPDRKQDRPGHIRMVEGEMRDDGSRPGMPDDNGVADVELPQGARDERGLPGGLGLA